MAKTCTHLTHGNYTGGGTTVNTASISPAANSVVILAVTAFDGASMSASGNGLTYTAVIDGVLLGDHRLWVFVGAGASPSAGVITLTFAADTFVNWYVDNVTGTVDLTTPVVVSNAQTATAISAAASDTMNAFGSATNGTWAYLQIEDSLTITEGSGFTDVYTGIGDAIFSFSQSSEYKDINDTTPDFGISASVRWRQGSLEISNAASGGANFTLTADTTTYAVAGQQATLTRSGRVVVAEHGVYTILGSAALVDSEIDLDHTTFTITGQDAGLRKSFTMSAENGAYVLVGNDASLLSSGAGPKIIVCENGTYAISGQAATLRRAVRVAALTGGYNLSGFSVVGGTAEDNDTISMIFRVRKVLIVPTTDRVKWVSYIPVKQVPVTAQNISRFNQEGAVEVELIGSGTGLIEWVDYIPVVEVTDSEAGRWRYDNAGWIPVVVVD